MDIRFGRMERQMKDLFCASRFGAAPPLSVYVRHGLLDFAQPAPDICRETGALVTPLPPQWSSFGPGDRWGHDQGHAWFRVTVSVPEALAGGRVALSCSTSADGGWDDTHSQFLVFAEGRPQSALDCNHREFILTDRAEAGQVFTVDLEGFFESDAHRLVEFACKLVGVDVEAEALWYDVTVPLGSAALLDEHRRERYQILGVLDRACDALDLRAPSSEAFRQSVRDAREILRAGLYDAPKGEPEALIWAIGHTHIDVAWLWTLAQTKEKVARSFPSMMYLLRRYPQFLFMSSQPQLYVYLKEVDPEAFEELRALVKAGRWEPEGGMWVEADCNIPCGESLIRQFLHGKAFFRDTFGVDSRILWLPDVFGYSAALPQIMKKCGIDYFMTTKISWNETNKLPYDTFLWEGLDGTRLLTHCVTTTSDYKLTPHLTSYNGMMTPEHVKGCYTRYQQKELSGDLLMCYGYGDGGGGTTVEQIETASRLERGIPGMPRVRHAKALDFFKKLEDKVRGNPALPTWVGELYLEYHRGTYTSMGIVKRLNRQCEQALMAAETLCAMSGEPAAPARDMDELWRTLLTNQFHDILPGSSIAEVYEDAVSELTGVLNGAREVGLEALRRLSGGSGDEAGGGLLVANTLGFARGGLVCAPKGHTLSVDGQPLPSQATEEGQLIASPTVPSKGYAAFALAPAAPCGNPLIITARHMENAYISLDLDENGEICGLTDKREGRELIASGQTANRITAYEDRPIFFDCWDINSYYRRKPYPVDRAEEITVTETGPVRGSVRVRRTFQSSTIVQHIRVSADSPLITFDTQVEWNESQILLKASFPVSIRSAFATYDVQFGSLTRPTHFNTSWDQAKFEVCAHKWADLSEGDYGVSLLNDCKYGYDIHGSTLSLTLLKSGTDPNPTADRGSHTFNYALYPHRGDALHCDVQEVADMFNMPLFACASPTAERAAFSLYSVACDHVRLETVKRAQDGEGHILRLYECKNRTGDTTLSLPASAARAWECDMLENREAELPLQDGALCLRFTPFEIKTIRVACRAE